MKPPSLRSRIIDFFCANPSEELTPQDAAIKFSCPLKSAQTELSELVTKGILTRRGVYSLRDLGEDEAE